MTLRYLLALLAAAPLSCAALAEADKCTDWTQQTNGTEFRLCVDQKGHRYCQEKNRSGQISKVDCRT